MKAIKATVFFFLLLPFMAGAQESDKGYYVWRDGWQAGLSIGGLYYNTGWNYIGSSVVGFTDDEAGHSSDRTMLFLSLEKRSIFGMKREADFGEYYPASYDYAGYIHIGDLVKFYVDFDAGAELMYGFGKTTADFLKDNDNVISSGGSTMGIGGYFKTSIVFPFKKVNFIPLSVGLNPMYMRIHNNAKGLPSYVLVDNYRDNPWTESVFTLNWTLGTLGLEFGKISIAPELRFMIFGKASSTLKTDNPTVSGAQSVSNKWAKMYPGWSIRMAVRL
jgi:hypothetical protein